MGWFSYSNDKSIRCLNEHFLRTCGSCLRLNTTSISRGKAYCSHVSYGHRLNEDIDDCSKYEGPVNPEKRDYTELYYEMTGRKYYFILSTICEILGIDMNNKLYQEIKTLIQLVRSDDSTIAEAIGYDAFGEEIANRLRNDVNNVEICDYLFNKYLVKVYTAIKLNNQEEAIKIYKDMVKELHNKYQQKDNYDNIVDVEMFSCPQLKTI